MKKSKILIDGIGRSYGKQRLILYKMNNSLKPPKIKEYSLKKDYSWKKKQLTILMN